MKKKLFNPFPGLRSFEEEEEYLFFGREKQIDELVSKLGKTRFLAVVGASGSGKSSLMGAILNNMTIINNSRIYPVVIACDDKNKNNSDDCKIDEIENSLLNFQNQTSVFSN